MDTKKLLLLASVGIAGLLIALVALGAWPSETDVTISYGPDGVYAEVEGTRLEVPREALLTDTLRLVSFAPRQQTPAAPDDSLYWQPAQPGALGFQGKAGEWLQSLRPGARWETLSARLGEYRARLVDGRTSARIDLGTDDKGAGGYAFVIRPERRAIAWWRLRSGAPVEQLAGGTYRPSGWNSVRDLAGELALVALAAGVLALLCWPVSPVLTRTAKTQRAQSSQSEDIRSSPPSGGRAYIVPLAFFVGGTVLAAAACVLVLDGIPHVQDDVAYIFQAKIFALGRWWVPAPPGPEFFANGFIEMFDGRWFSKYPPGYPVLLVPALWAGVPWLVNALSAGVTLALVYAMGARMYGPHVAVWAGLLGLLSPWVIFMSGSYMSHPTTMMWVVLFAYSLVRMKDEGRRTKDDGRWTMDDKKPSSIVWPLLGGFSMGMAFITREWTAIGVAAGAALWALGDVLLKAGCERWSRLGRYALMFVGFLPPLLLLLYENRQLTGDWFRLAQDLVGSYDRPGFGPGHGDAQGHTPALGVYNALVYLRTLATVFDGWPAPLALAPVFLGLFAWVGEGTRKRLAWDAFNVLCALGLVAAYYLWWSSTTIFGPRYWYEAMPFLLLLAGRGLDLLGRLAGSGLRAELAVRLRWIAPAALFGLLALYNVSQSLPYQTAQYRDYNGISADPLRNAESAGLKNALVFVALDPAKPNRDYGKVFFANDPLLRGDVVYARDLGPERNQGLLAQFPARAPYWLPLNGPPQPGFGPAARR